MQTIVENKRASLLRLACYCLKQLLRLLIAALQHPRKRLTSGLNCSFSQYALNTTEVNILQQKTPAQILADLVLSWLVSAGEALFEKILGPALSQALP